MATNATTWFYREPEHRAYYIEERVNHTFWSNRITDLYLDCTSEESPFRVEGEWSGRPLSIEWTPNEYLRLSAAPGENVDLLVTGVKEILGFPPTVSYLDAQGHHVAEWYVTGGDQRLREIQGNPNYRSVTRHAK